MRTRYAILAIATCFLLEPLCFANDIGALLQRLEALESEVAELRRENAEMKRSLQAVTGSDLHAEPAVGRLEAGVDSTPMQVGLAESLPMAPRRSASDLSRGLPDWLSRTRISGNADFSAHFGQENSHSPDNRLAIENARLFFDFGISEKASFYFEWDIVREFSLENEVGQMYVQWDRLFDFKELNLRVGRFPIPFGEEYLRFHEQRWDNPLITYSGPAPYNWDEGIELFGAVNNSRFEYAVAVTDGDNNLNVNTNEAPQFAGKFTARPAKWAKLVLSIVDTGSVGSSSKDGITALEFGGTHAYAVGSFSRVDTYQNGVVVNRDPDGRISLRAWELDAILSSLDWGHIWLAYGQADVKSNSSSFYDRNLQYWIAEGVLELGTFSDALSAWYLAARYSAIGTFDSDEGYALEVMNEGKNLGYNTEVAEVISLGVGVRVQDHIKLKLEYAWYDFDLVDGVTSALKDSSDKRNLLGLGMAVKF